MEPKWQKQIDSLLAHDDYEKLRQYENVPKFNYCLKYIFMHYGDKKEIVFKELLLKIHESIPKKEWKHVFHLISGHEITRVRMGSSHYTKSLRGLLNWKDTAKFERIIQFIVNTIESGRKDWMGYVFCLGLDFEGTRSSIENGYGLIVWKNEERLEQILSTLEKNVDKINHWNGLRGIIGSFEHTYKEKGIEMISSYCRGLLLWRDVEDNKFALILDLFSYLLEHTEEINKRDGSEFGHFGIMANIIGYGETTFDENIKYIIPKGGLILWIHHEKLEKIIAFCKNHMKKLMTNDGERNLTLHERILFGMRETHIRLNVELLEETSGLILWKDHLNLHIVMSFVEKLIDRDVKIQNIITLLGASTTKKKTGLILFMGTNKLNLTCIELIVYLRNKSAEDIDFEELAERIGKEEDNIKSGLITQVDKSRANFRAVFTGKKFAGMDPFLVTEEEIEEENEEE